ncbi:hypothetical protein [Nocardia wallacei]|uniref:hypothetical protein n=1 Tax=Nocardia wallacei TaxID=480035 RepID=UPI002456E442|nr:hypothetical protein [Nocardia wallacei]
MAKKNNVTRLPTRLGTTARHAAEPVQAAVRDYLAARYRLTEQLALVDALLEQGAAEPLEQQATALGERLISVHSSLIRLTTTVAIRQTAADSTVLSTALADATAPLASQRAEPQPAPASASETTSLSTIDELKALGADSVVIQSPITESGRPRPFQRGDDGQWHSHTIGRGGISSDSLWNGGGGLVVVLRTDRPVTAGATPAQRIAAEAGFRGWQVRDDDHGRLRLTRGEIAIDLRYSTASGSITKATRTHADGRVDHAAAVGKLGTVLRWLKDDQ